MIPSSFFGRLAQPSPEPTTRDLARMIHRTIGEAIKAKHELGFATVSIGCDGVKHTTMLDGSSCQTDGDVCIATREDGITACIDAPARGNGLTFSRIAFEAPVCAPVTGWWIVDAAGYMYRVPTALVTAAPYWPITDVTPSTSAVLLRAGTWDRLMCAADLVVPLNGQGGAVWYLNGESDWAQLFVSSIGRGMDTWLSVPGIAVVGPDLVMSGGSLRLYGINVADATDTVVIPGVDAIGNPLTEGTEFSCSVWYDPDGAVIQAGPLAATGASVAPTVPPDGLWLAEVLCAYGAAPVVVDTVAAGTLVETYPYRADGLDGGPLVPPDYLDGLEIGHRGYRGVLLRDTLAPNAGLRRTVVTLPSATGGVVTGAIRVAYGYPFGHVTASLTAGPASVAPAPRANVVGTWQADCVGRLAGDMALVYRRGLGVEYAPYHLCLDGPAITDANDYVSLAEVGLTSGPARDVAACLVGLPSGEVAILGGDGDLRSGLRYRVRPAPDTPVTVSIAQRAKGLWGDDPNLWVRETSYGVDPWGNDATTFAVDAAIASAEAPGRPVAVVLWESDDAADTYLTAPVAYGGMLGQTSGGLTTIAWDVGETIVASSLAYRYLTVVGREPYAAWGWTFVVGGVESALSLIVGPSATSYHCEPAGPLFSAEITVPGGPTGTTERRVYRLAWDYGSSLTGIVSPIGPWAYGANPGGGVGAVYDRHCRLVKTLPASFGEPGTDPIAFYDEDLDLTTLGTRPPSPLIPTGTLTIEAPLPVHVLPPMNL